MAARSREAHADLDWLMAQPPDSRRGFYERLEGTASRAFVAEVTDQLGTPWGCFVDDPVGFYEVALGESMYDQQRVIAESVRDNERTAVPSGHSLGKALALDTPIPCPDGWTTMKEVQPGDVVYDEQGQESAVIEVSPVHSRPLYRVTFSDGTWIDASDDHLWSVLTAGTRSRLRRRADRMGDPHIRDWRAWWHESQTVTTEEMVSVGTDSKHIGRRWAVPIAQAIEGRRAEFGIPGYLLGFWLGDGTSSQAALTIGDADAPDILAILEAEGVTVSKRRSRFAYGLPGGPLYALRDLGVLDNKHVPDVVMRAPYEYRFDVMCGLIDSDGYYAKDGFYIFEVTDEALALSALELARTLGWRPSVSSRPARLYGKDCGTRWAVMFSPDVSPSRLTRKTSTGATSPKWSIRTITSITPLGEADVKCIQVDSPSSLYLAGEGMIPTHNSHLAARLVLWFVFAHPPGTARVILTSHSWSQLEQELWAHVRQAHARAQLPGDCQTSALKLGDPPQAVAYCKSPRAGDEQAFGGIHAMHVLTVVDEAGGMHPTTGQALEALMTGAHARQLLMGNPPADASGSPEFENRCAKPTYNVVRLNVLQSPNYTGEATPLCKIHPEMPDHTVGAHLVSGTWADDVKRDVGEDHPYYVARVLAEFPTDLAGKVIPRSFIDASRAADIDGGTWVRLGVDPASGGGDELAIARAEGATVRIVTNDRMSPTVGAHDVAGKVLAQIEAAEEVRSRLGETRRVRVKVENDGGIGWAVSTVLKAWRKEGRHDAEIIPVTVGSGPESAKGKERFANKRGEMWWNARDLLAPTQIEGDDGQLVNGPPRVHLDIDDQTARQLSAPNIEYHSSGRNLVESKESMRKRGVSSPDRADAVVLCLYEPKPAGPATVRRFQGRLPGTGSGWN